MNAKLAKLFVSLKQLVQQPSTKISLQRLKETFDEANPLANWVVPAQTVCNYWNYFFTMLPNGLSDRDRTGFSFRQSAVNFPLGTNVLSVGGVKLPIPGQVQAGLAGYSGIQANGRASDPVNINGPGGSFQPFSLPILQGHPYGPTGQPFTRDANGGATPDCQPGQTGYFYGQDPLRGQAKNNPAEGNPDIPGSRGVTDIFWKKNGAKTIKDTRIASHQP